MVKTKYIMFFFVVALILVSCTSVPKEEPAAPEPQAPQKTVEAVPTPEPETPPVVEPVPEVKPVETPKDYSDQNGVQFEKLEAARKAAIEARAPELLKGAFDETEVLYTQRKNENQDKFVTEDLSSIIADMTARYEALENAAKAYAAKQHIDEMNLSQYDKTDYDRGEAAAAAIVDLYNNRADGQALLVKAKEGNEAYSRSLITGLKRIAALARADALKAKKLADSVYAGVSEKVAYKAATDGIAKSDSNLVTGNPELAYTGYQDAAGSFTRLYESVSKKRTAAQKSMDEAKEKVESAAAYASDADGKAPLGDEKVEGIESDDTVLLEPDTYADPAQSVIDVNDSTDGKAAASIEKVVTQNNSAPVSSVATADDGSDVVTGGTEQ